MGCVLGSACFWPLFGQIKIRKRIEIKRKLGLEKKKKLFGLKQDLKLISVN